MAEPLSQDTFVAQKRTLVLPNGVRLAYAELGDATGVPVILLHGFTDSARSWSLIVPYLRAVEFLDEALMQGLEDQLDRMDRVTTDPKKWKSLHADFHDMIYRAAGMPRLMTEIARLRESTTPYTNMYINVHKIPEMPGFEHRALLSALGRKDPQLARNVLAEHIRSAAAGVVYFLSGGPRSDGSAGQEPAAFIKEK